ncbi:MATE family efflux transporter [Bacteroidia bacterium]|nr:MATE family efflux transporter [Bacteroidia bacterium]
MRRLFRVQNRASIKELGTEPIGKLLLKYSVPAVIGTLSVSLYNIIDRIFIGQGISAYAIAGLAITFPIMMFLQAFGTLVGVGAASRISIVLGMRKRRLAEAILGNAVILTLFFWVILSGLGLIFLDDLLRAFGASVNTLQYAKEFMVIVIPAGIFSNIAFGLASVMRATGYPQKSMTAIVLGVVVNTILAPVFIFGFDMGIQGAATATAIAMFISSFFVLSHFFDIHSEIRFTPRAFRLRWSIISNIVSIGMAPFLMNLVASGIVVFVNQQLFRYGGDLAIGAYGIVISYVNVFIMTIIGICQGMQPIVGYNYGAGQRERMKRTLMLTIKVAISINAIGFILALCIPGALTKLFSSDLELIEKTKVGLRYMFLMFPLVGFQVVLANFFQSIGKAQLSIFMSLSRQVLFYLPCLYTFPIFFDLIGIWISSPVSDLLSVIVAFIVMQHQKKIFTEGKL